MGSDLHSVLSERLFKKAHIEGLVSAARILVGLQLDVAAGPKAVCEAIATAINYPLPPGLDIPVDILA